MSPFCCIGAPEPLLAMDLLLACKEHEEQKMLYVLTKRKREREREREREKERGREGGRERNREWRKSKRE